MKTEDTEALGTPIAKPSKIKARYSRPTYKNCLYHCYHFNSTQYCNIVAICRHHPPQTVVLSQICCFWERKVVVFQILLDDDSAEARDVGTT